jgi:hypothetical protein
MGIMMFIMLKREIPGLKDELDGKGLAWHHVDLDSIATGIGVPTLSDFVSMTAEEMEEMMAAAGQDVPEGFKEEWFPAADGLRTVEALLVHFRHHLATVKKFQRGEGVVGDLKEAARILGVARRHRVRFHFTCAY